MRNSCNEFMMARAEADDVGKVGKFGRFRTLVFGPAEYNIRNKFKIYDIYYKFFRMLITRRTKRCLVHT